MKQAGPAHMVILCTSHTLIKLKAFVITFPIYYVSQKQKKNKTKENMYYTNIHGFPQRFLSCFCLCSSF